MFFLWTLVWLMCLLGACVSAVATLIVGGVAIESEDLKMLASTVGLLFLTAFLGWGAWAASFMS